jgi:hypothetical protein
MGWPTSDIAQVTVRRRAVTRALATDAYDELGCAGIRFPSRLDGLPCYALFEGRARLEAIDSPIPFDRPPLPRLSNPLPAIGALAAASTSARHAAEESAVGSHGRDTPGLTWAKDRAISDRGDAAIAAARAEGSRELLLVLLLELGLRGRPGCWDDAPLVGAADAPTLLCGGDKSCARQSALCGLVEVAHSVRVIGLEDRAHRHRLLDEIAG